MAESKKKTTKKKSPAKKVSSKKVASKKTPTKKAPVKKATTRKAESVDPVCSGASVTFTVTRVPSRPAQRKTLLRLMHLQPDKVRGLRMLQRLRRQRDNVTSIRAGRPWTNRARATRLCRLERGASFSLRLTPHILPDIASVRAFLDASPDS